MKNTEQISFRPSILDLFLNPAYVARVGLYHGIIHAAQQATGKLLDFGCGRKPYSSLFSKITVYHGIDTNHSGHDHTRTKADFFYDGLVLPFADSEYDTVFSSQVLEHVPDIQYSLNEIHRVLKVGGLFIATVPFMWGEHERPHDYRRFTRWGLEKMLREAGFNSISTQPTSRAIPTFAQIFTAWFADSVCGGRKWLVYFLTPIFFAPIHLLSMVLSRLLPDNGHWYLDLIVIAKKEATTE